MSMDEDKKLLKSCLVIFALLAVLGAVWRVLSYQPGSVRASSSSTNFSEKFPTESEQSRPVSEAVQELLMEPATGKNASTDFSYATTPATQPRQAVAQKYAAYPPQNASAKQPYITRPSVKNRYVEQPSYTSATNVPNYYANTTPRRRGSSVGPNVHFNPSAAQLIEQERASMLAPYLRPNKKDKARMDAQWNQLATAIERAVARALTPKSKKEEMIEKYAAAKPGNAAQPQMPGFEGPLAPVGQQIAVQKQQMMQDVGSVFGSSAAQEVGGIMDSFASEVASALNAPNSTAEQKAEKVQDLARKYQDKMDKVVEQKQYDKFVAQRVEKINQQKEQFRTQYEGRLSEQLGKNLEEEWQQEQQLATQNLPVDEYNMQLAQLHQTKRNERQQLVLSQGKSINPLLEMEKKEEEQALKDLKAKVEAGEVVSIARAATPNEMKQMQADVQVKTKDTLEKIAQDPLLGPKAAAEFKPILDNYQQQLNQLYQQELSIDERREQESKLLKGVNRQLLDKQKEAIENLDMPEDQKRPILEELNKAYNAI